MRYILILVLGLNSFGVFGQLIDSIQESLTYKPKLVLKMDARNAFVTANYVKVKGVKIGLSYHNVFRFGLGYSWMKGDYETKISAEAVLLKFGYANAFAEYTFYQSKHWQLEIPVQLGVGRISYKSANKDLLAKQWVPIWEPAMTVEYIFLKYFGVGMGAGYRLVIKSKNPIQEQFTSPIYIFKFKIYFGDIYKDVKKKFPNPQ